ncbi:Gfo/Idh/MocA family protein [uncultured Phycicoccus sp.]|uniref:Gfo/Idh/MocA family protein n=1 Tax=uncultured Phycicoccus sp. TaxID=661422 RepID=UPI0026257357|nr:Gfo/Idh/MocA family oxidoreductase [uncultured Phycicoccus sp.]
MREQVRIGLIGTSDWADGFHLPAVASHESGGVVAICGRDRQRAEALAEKHGVPGVYTDYRAMIDQAPLDAVIVATPEDLHHPMTMAALEAGKHVLCEKPMAFSTAESQEMLDAAEAAGVKHMIQFTNRGLPHYRFVKQLLDDGYVGEPYQAYFSWPTGWFPDSDIAGHRWAFDARRAKGAASELGAHMIDLARWFLGDVVRVSATLRNFVEMLDEDGTPMENANDSAYLLLDFVGGAHGAVHVGSPNITGDDLHHSGQVVVISGSDGTLEARCDPWTDPGVSEIRGLRRGASGAATLTIPDTYLDGADPDDMFEVFMSQSIGPRLFIDAIIHDLAVSPSFSDGHAVQRIIDAAVASNLTGTAQVL